MLDADTVAVTGTVSDDGATVAVNGVAAIVTPAGDGSATFTATLALVNGPNPLRAVAIDGAGRSGSARVVAWRDASAPPIQITSPASRAWVGPDGDGNAVVDVSGVIDLDAEPRLAAVVVASPVGQVTATVNPVTGAFTAPAVPLDTSLAPGTAQPLTATATDTLGHAGVSHVDVLYDATGPAIRLTAPADLARFSEASPATVAVTGDAWAAEGAQIDVNGAGLDPATLTWDPAGADGRHHVAFTAEIARPDADGAFAVVARVTGLDDRSATVRRLLSMDSTAPTVVETVPADGAAGVDPNALVLALFSEPIRHDTLTAPDGLTLTRLSTGDPVVGEVAVAGQAVAFVPGSELAAGESYRLALGPGVTDLVGHPLAAPVEATFEVARSATAAAPVLDALPAVVCAADLTVTGTSAPGARVVVRAGALAFSGYADSAGRFAVVLPLPGNGWQLLRVAAEDASGVRGPEATATVRVDCSAPSVVAATFDRDTATITVELSEPVDPATAALGSGASVTLDDAELPGTAPDPAGSLAVTGDGSVLEIAVDPAADAWWRDRPVRLTVRPPLADLQGNPMAAAFETVFFPSGSGGPSGGFLFGEAWSDLTGRPLDGVTARLFVSGDALPGAVAPGGAATPLAEVVTDARGRFQIAGDVAPGRYVLVLEGVDTTRVVRRLTLGPGAGAVPFDSRLTPLAASAGDLDPVAGGTLTAPGAPLVSLTADPAAIPGLDPLAVHLTVVGDQALPDLLPLGWTPAAAAEVRLEDASGALPEGDATAFAAGGVRLTLPLPAWVLASDDLHAARYDLATGAWRSLAAPERVDGPDGEPLARVTLDGPGTVAVLLPDSDDATRPPLPAGPGESLAGAALPETAPSLLGQLVLDPPVIPPTEHADARVVARSADGVTPWPSGLAVRAVLAETLHLSDGSQLLEAPFAADLVLYRPHLSPDELGGAVEAAAGAADFVVSPSPRASEVLLDVGYEDVTLYPFPEQIERGHVVGPSGGRVTSDGGVELELPEGALPAATVVRASLLDATALAGLPTVDGFDTLAAVSVELGGRTLARSATLRLPAPDGAPADDPSDPRLVLARAHRRTQPTAAVRWSGPSPAPRAPTAAASSPPPRRPAPACR